MDENRNEPMQPPESAGYPDLNATLDPVNVYGEASNPTPIKLYQPEVPQVQQPFQSVAQPPIQQEQQVVQNPWNQQAPTPEKKSGKKKLFTIIGIVTALVAIAGALVYFFLLKDSNNADASPEDVVLAYTEAFLYMDLEAMGKYTPYDIEEAIVNASHCYDEAEFFNMVSEEMDVTIRSWEDFYATFSNTISKEQQSFLDGYNATFALEDMNDISIQDMKSEYEDILQMLEKYTSFDIDDVTEAKVATVSFTLADQYETGTNEDYAVLVKYNGSWKVIVPTLLEP